MYVKDNKLDLENLFCKLALMIFIYLGIPYIFVLSFKFKNNRKIYISIYDFNKVNFKFSSIKLDQIMNTE